MAKYDKYFVYGSPPRRPQTPRNIAYIDSDDFPGTHQYNCHWVFVHPDDPNQQNNVIAQYPEKAHELHKMLLDLMRETNISRELLEPRLELQLQRIEYLGLVVLLSGRQYGGGK